jgi:uncharacterized tellurite resistance protein B-like protein
MTINAEDKKANLGTLWLFKEHYGFSQVPPNIAYDAYLKSLLICAKGDGTLADEERDWVIGHAAAFNTDPAILEELKNYNADEDIETVISGDLSASESRRFLIFEAIQACAADGEYNEKERAVVLKGAKKLNISEDEFKRIEEIYFETVKLREKRLAVMYPDGLPL